MKILVSGSTGLVGKSLVPFLTTGGHTVVPLVRSATADRESPSMVEAVRWDPMLGSIDRQSLEGLDAVVHLAGENIAGGRWTERRKRAIRNSRVEGTRLLAETLAKLAPPPRVLVCASAIGIYGNRGDVLLDEDSGPGTGFLVDVCREWEAAADPARARGIRVVHLRLGIVLTPAGGALAKMLMPFKLGAGGPVGNGRQYWSWVAIDDVIGAIHQAVTDERLSGPVNVVAPNATTNAEFTKTLARVLHRPAFVRTPAFVIRAILGEMADELLLASTRVAPRQLEAVGYPFRFPELEGALRHVLGR